MQSTVKLGGNDVVVAVTGYTLLVYEDNFKGRNFLKDADSLLTEAQKVPFGTAVKILWAVAKTADPKIEAIEAWSSKFELAEVLPAVNTAVDLVLKSLQSGEPKNTAAATA